jgi:hypothetical protein
MRYLLFVLAALFVTPAWSQALVIATCGSGAYPIGQLHQLTMNPAGYLCVSTTTALGTLGEGQGAPPHALGARPPGDVPRPPTPLPEPKK